MIAQLLVKSSGFALRNCTRNPSKSVSIPLQYVVTRYNSNEKKNYEKNDKNQKSQPAVDNQTEKKTSVEPTGPPENFFDATKEADQEWLDIAMALMKGGFTKLTDVQAKDVTWKEFEESTYELDPKILPEKMSPEFLADLEKVKDPKRGKLILEALSNPELAETFEKYEEPGIIPFEQYNYNAPLQKEVAYADEHLSHFVNDKSDLKYRSFQEGNQHCTGKKQRSGKLGTLRCHKIDLEKLNYLDVLTLRPFLSDDAEILGRSATGLCAKCQRKVAKTIKRSRNLGILPHIGEYEIQEVRPMHRGVFHDPVSVEKVKSSKTVL